MSDFQAIADRGEIEALRGEFTDAAMMHDRARLASLFTPDDVLQMPNIPVELVGREEIRAGGERLQAQWDFFVQTTHPGTIQLDGDTATGRAYIQELARARDGRQGLNYAIYHDRYQRTGDGWKFTERVYEVRYLDTSPLTGSAPRPAGAPANPPAVPLRHDPAHSPARPRRQASKWPPQSSDIGLDTDSQPGDQRRIPSQINLICAAADPRSRRVSASRTAATCAQDVGAAATVRGGSRSAATAGRTSTGECSP